MFNMSVQKTSPGRVVTMETIMHWNKRIKCNFRQMGGKTDRRTDRQKGERTDGQTGSQVGGRTEKWTDGQRGGQMDGQRDRQNNDRDISIMQNS